jgi:hypothetical protein
MYSALYYPYSSIEDENLLRTSLLLWDTVTTLVPDPGFRPEYPDEKRKKAWNLIGRVHTPSEDEKGKAHKVIEDFLDGPIRNEFLYNST